MTLNVHFSVSVSGLVHSVQENDGSYFESFTALSWKNENRRMSAVRAVETRAEVLPENDNDRLLEDDIERSEQKEHLYLDVLYAIANTVGAPAPGGQVTVMHFLSRVPSSFLMIRFCYPLFDRQSNLK